MTINAISSAMSVSIYLQSASKSLSSDLIEKLLDLGINPSTVTSEAEATRLITEAEETDKASTSDSEQEEDSSNQSTGSAELYNKAVDLADKVGVRVSEGDDIDDILDKVQDVIDKMLSYAIDTNDESLYDKFQVYQSDLDDINAEMNGGGFTYSGTTVYSFMDMVAEQNKYALGLNKKEENK